MSEKLDLIKVVRQIDTDKKTKKTLYKVSLHILNRHIVSCTDSQEKFKEKVDEFNSLKEMVDGALYDLLVAMNKKQNVLDSKELEEMLSNG